MAGTGAPALALLALLSVPFGADADVPPEPVPECAPWPGEIDPLPSAHDPDELQAQWARLRASELTVLASRLEPVDAIEAHRTWLHALCVDPDGAAVAEGVARTITVAVMRAAPLEPADDAEPESIAPVPPAAVDPTLPDVAAEPPTAPSETPRAEPAPERCGPTPRTCPPLRAADRALAKIEALVQGAHFDEAISLQRRVRAALEPLGATPLGRDRRARLEVLIGTSEVALGRRERALTSFERALEADPTLELDRARTSPKVMRVFDEVRSSTLARRGG